MQTPSSSFNIDVKEISTTKWDSNEGIQYQQVPGANLGVTSFEVIDNNSIAFLCNSTNEIDIVNKADGKDIRKIALPFSPRDFVYSKGYYFVLAEQQVYQYSAGGKEINEYPFPAKYRGVERLTRYYNSTYILLPSGNSLLIESNGHSVAPQEREGWVTTSGNFVETKLSGNNTYYIRVTGAKHKPFEMTYDCDKKVAGVYVVGSTDKKLVLDVQTFISEDPISVDRNIVVINLSKDALGVIAAKIKVPDCYYVLSNKDMLVNKNGTILNMVTSPQGISVFSLTENNSKSIKDYPNSLIREKYHFNDHLMKNNQY